MVGEISVGQLVWVFKLGSEGEVVHQARQDNDIQYHIHIPSENETYVYSSEELYVFGPEAEANIRREWQQKLIG